MLKAEVAQQLGIWAATAAVIAVAARVGAHDPITTKVTWEREIAPIFRARCLSCHSPDGRAPMPLTTYAEARPWARAIREEVLARRMPKWPVVRGYGDFTNDPSLSAFEIALITAWVDGGAPKSTAQPIVSASPPSGASGSTTLIAPKTAPSSSREIVVPCEAQRLPDGRLVAVEPALDRGADLRLMLEYRDGTIEPLIWIRGFDPRFPRSYALRTPAPLDGSRLLVDGDRRRHCRLTLSVGE